MDVSSNPFIFIYMAYRPRIRNIVAAVILYAAYWLIIILTYLPLLIYDLHCSFVIVMANYCNPL
jgi:hypothetical protein